MTLRAEVAPSVLRVGISDDYAPFARSGRGFDVEVARALARDLGMKIEWVRFTWPELSAAVAANRFDVAMSGVTWRPDRGVVGWTTTAVAQGGPCVVGDPSRGLVAVNRGGVLERFARERFPAQAVAVDDNRALPALLEGGAVSAFVTDSFEAASRPLPRDTALRCEPRRDRKVYWVAPARAAELGPRLDGWIAEHEPLLRRLRRRWLGDAAPRDAVDDLVDRLARRLELMPAVAAFKRTRGLPIEDPPREARVLERAQSAAAAAGLDAASVRALFVTQIDLAKAVERRGGDAPPLDLERELRPALSRIGDDIVARLAALAPLPPSALEGDRLAPLGGLLHEDEMEKLRVAILAVRRRSR